MTKVILDIKRDDGPVWFDCQGHAGDREVCGMVSTLLNFLVVYMEERGEEPVIYEKGHLRFDIEYSNMQINRVFQAVIKTLQALQKEYPERLKVY